jgi:hypothetical protein
MEEVAEHLGACSSCVVELGTLLPLKQLGPFLNLEPNLGPMEPGEPGDGPHWVG